MLIRIAIKIAVTLSQEHHFGFQLFTNFHVYEWKLRLKAGDRMLIERGGAKSLLWCALVSNKQTRVSKKLFFRLQS